ncbi:PIR Superfamily Protein [Plasmodium ovale wallikeri]|uniref:PIR Superfamily Protein n=1 Tax=Plasmodium ovale wallikeri TaxID=864142 RepID=A0A1A9ARA7_PLAOA|nr:PIR Superfamily Protein [Plasmodium ovale wallikeri]SBT59238.1 PIR Superfamily Protein [Plasmodium ovale wallikeri]
MTSEYDNISRLTSIRSYNNLDINFVSEGDYTKCSQFHKDSGEYSPSHAFCLSLTGNLKNYEKLLFFGELNSHKCNFLNLWAYHRLSKFEGEEHYNVKKFIIDHWYNYKDYETCNSTEFVLYLARDADYIKAKQLYDYALNYYKLKEHHYDNDIPCTSKEQEYIRKSIELYQGIKSECEHNNKAHISYCMAYKEIKEIHPNDGLLNLQCKTVEDETVSSSGGRNELGEMETVHQQQQVVGPQGDRIAHDSSYGLHSPSGSHQAMATAVPILGISSIFFLLYKFTGLGSMARNLLRTKGINGMNSHEEMTHELLENTYDDNAYSDITETYIGYQAT